MRLLTIVKNVPELKVIVEGLIAGLKSVGYIVLLLLLVSRHTTYLNPIKLLQSNIM